MRKVIFIAMAALTLLTAQCKKNEPKPEEKVMVPITGSVDFGGSKTEITTAGYITPVSGDKIYIYYEGGYAGYMTCTPTTGQQFTCSGEIEEDCLGKACTFMYLGTGSTEADGTTGISEASSTFSFADQTSVSVSDGKISGLDKFHVGSCQAQVSTDGKVTLPMATKMSIAYFQLTDGTNPIADQDVTISGVSATAAIDKTNGTISGDGTGSITVHTDAQGKFYMALVPQSGSVTFGFSVDGKIGSNVFPYGIRECSFYSEQGSGNPLQVTLAAPPTFTVSSGVTVSFSPGNLQYLGKSDGTGTWRFAEHQWDCMGDGPTSGTTSQGNVDLSSLGYSAGMYNTGSGNAGGEETDADKAAARDLFGWGCTGYQDTRTSSTGYQTNYQPYSTRKTDVTSTNPAYNINRYGYGPDYDSGSKYGLTVENKSDWGCVTGLPSAGEGKSWRTLSKDEWAWLLGPSGSTNPGTNCRTSSTINGTENARYAEVKVNGVCGMMVFPDVFAWPSDVEGAKPSTFNTNSSDWNGVDYSTADFGKLESAGVVFLPAAGYRNISTVSKVGSDGRYWASSSYNSPQAYYLVFSRDKVRPLDAIYRADGGSVRLVSEN